MSTSHTELPLTLPVIDLDVFRGDPETPEAALECRKAADALIEYGALVVKDSRVSESDNEAFLDLMENYFAQPEDVLKKDERPQWGYQVGVTLEKTEKPKCKSDESCLHIIERLEPSERPLDLTGHEADAKCRFFYRMGQKPPYETEFPSLNMSNVEPQGFPAWKSTMETWGQSMKNAVEGVAEMAALGLGLEPDRFTSAGLHGPHLLAPTSSDLNKFGQKNSILAGFHSDLNFLNSGKRIAVKVPAGRYLLVQAGKQLEHLSGGLIQAGYHEVVVNDATISALGHGESANARDTSLDSDFKHVLLALEF
ncbi:hypothetical protein FRB96_008491 [Tulasnella sp. 330]|nr:hypothetical protein FRB96_008491 [Tulasnella sp. 330]KAG8878599.1 hypothetical protein FRB97_002381 [Tulasnella sp. 331]